MAGKKKSREFKCTVVNEVVKIRLTLRRGRGFGGEPYLFIQCDQLDCQYVDENKLPCPLNLDMFADEIRDLEEKKRLRKEYEED
jgi:hypothetical protein